MKESSSKNLWKKIKEWLNTASKILLVVILLVWLMGRILQLT